MFNKILSVIVILSILILFPSITVFANDTNPKVIMKTAKGDMTIELYADKAPITVANFLSYVDDKFYDATIFHRVIAGFMIQGGGYTVDFHKKATKPPIKNEATNGLSNKKYTIAMARLPEPHSASAQFFINHKDNPGLDHKSNNPDEFGYCVFGKVIEGTEVVEAIAGVKTMTRQGQRDVPRETIEIISVRRIE